VLFGTQVDQTFLYLPVKHIVFVNLHYLLLRILKKHERSVAEFRYQLVNQKIQGVHVGVRV
jgi:hypothetical protein